MKTNTIKNSKSELLSRPEPRSTGKLPKINLALRRTNRSLATDQLLSLLRNETPRFHHQKCDQICDHCDQKCDYIVVTS